MRYAVKVFEKGKVFFFKTFGTRTIQTDWIN